MTATQAEMIAIKKGVEKRGNDELTAAYHVLQKTGDASPLNGIDRTYERNDDDGDQFPPQRTSVQVKVPDVIDMVRETWTRLLDVVATIERTNCEARADVIIEGDTPDDEVTLLSDVPVTTLLALERHLVHFRTFIDKMPKLDPSRHWDFDDNEGVWKTDAVRTSKTKKVKKVLKLAPATKEHAEQVQVYDADETIGYWSTVLMSGAVQGTYKRELLDRVERLQRAVKSARERANRTPVVDHKIGAALFDHLFAPATAPRG